MIDVGQTSCKLLSNNWRTDASSIAPVMGENIKLYSVETAKNIFLSYPQGLKTRKVAETEGDVELFEKYSEKATKTQLKTKTY